MYCPNCGSELSGSPSFCPECGARLADSNAQRVQQPYQRTQQPYFNNQVYVNVDSADPFFSPKSKMVALLLCIFGGFFGLHYFYVGRFGMGILYFFTGGLLGFGWIVDIIRILMGSFRDRDRRRLAK